MGLTGMSLLWFGFVLALIPLSLWLLKRSGLATSAGAAQVAPMRTVSQLNLGPGQRLLTVEVGQGEERRWLVLGVTPQGISALHSLSPQGEAPEASAQPTPAAQAAFATLLRRAAGR
jgi:flagellar protein FliO/FliZ